jgi:hypothetical protein
MDADEGVTVSTLPVTLVFQVYVAAPLAVKEAVEPRHTEAAFALTEIVGLGFA